MRAKLTDRGIIIEKVATENYKNILIIKMSSLGDVIHTLPFSAALRGL